jgi:hypothetical protein
VILDKEEVTHYSVRYLVQVANFFRDDFEYHFLSSADNTLLQFPLLLVTLYVQRCGKKVSIFNYVPLFLFR